MKKCLPFLLVFVIACGGDDDGPAADAAPADASAENPLIAARPYSLGVPSSYDASKPTPLVLLLHGYSASSFAQVRLFGLLDGSEKHGYLIAYPDGLTDADGKQFWNATDACCNFDNNPVDDVAYLSAVLDDVQAKYNVDPKRIFVIGHSNGGYMAHRLGCDVGERLAAIVSLAGMQWKDPAKCPAAAKLNVLQVHGDDDNTVYYQGSARYPSAPETVAIWAAKNGCTGALVGDETMDLVVDVAGAETLKQAYEGCPAGGAVELWTIHGGGHVPQFVPAEWEDLVWAWMQAHAKG
jgi:polyhydroxybutyrate depolymerase